MGKTSTRRSKSEQQSVPTDQQPSTEPLTQQRRTRRSSRVETAVEPAPQKAVKDRKRKADAAASEQQPALRPKKARKSSKKQDTPTPEHDQGNSDHVPCPQGCGPSTQALPASTRTRRQPDVKSTEPAAPCDVQEVQPATDPAQPFDPANPEHISVCLAALGTDAASQNPAADTAQTPEAPAGRHQQFEQLLSELTSACEAGSGRSVYISGLPGTGKSHTVRAVVRALQASATTFQAPLAAFVSCFSQTDAGRIHAAVLNQIASQAGDPAQYGCADTLSAEDAYSKLVSYLQGFGHRPRGSSGKSSGKSSKAKKGKAKNFAGSVEVGTGRQSVVIVLDEVDRLLSARSGLDNMVRLFMLPHTPGVQCCVVALANSIDVTERCLPELKLRGCAPLFMPFGAYLRPQLLAILHSKLAGLPWLTFDPAALELVARKVAGNTGDVRKALQACRLALRILQEQCTGAGAATSALPVSPRHATACPSGSPFLGSPRRGLTSPPRAALACPLSPTRRTLVLEAGEGQGNAGQAAPTALAPAAAGGSKGCMVTAKEMVAALARITYQSDSSASSVNAIRNLPQQQQVHLLALASALATAATQAATDAAAEAAAAEHGLTASAYKAKYYWGPSSVQKPKLKLSNPFAQAAGTPAKAGTPLRPAATGQGTPLTASKGVLAGDAARAVPLSDAYQSYRVLCSGMFQQPCSEQEFCSTQQLLSHLGLVGVSGESKGAGGRSKSVGAGGGLAGVKLTLRASMKDIQNALKDNAVFRKALAMLPGA